MRDSTEMACISNAVPMQLVQFVRSQVGEDGVAELVTLAGETRDLDQVELTGWTSWQGGKALLEAAAQVLGSSEALREVAKAWMRTGAPGEIISLLQSLGSPGDLLRSIGAIATKFCTVVFMEPIEIHEDSAVVTATMAPGFERYQALCDYTAGLLGVAPVIFGLERGEVVETECQLRGAPLCRYEVRWQSEPLAAEAELEFLRQELSVLVQRFEAFKSTARDLVSGIDIDSLLAKITESAAVAVRAPAYVLIVRPTPDSPRRVKHHGLSGDEIDRLADQLDSGAVECAGENLLVAEVASERRRYGRLAAVLPDGARFLAEEHSVLSSYAELAAAALDAATALDQATRENATARTLLELAASLAVVSSPTETAESLARAVPGVVGCDYAAVLLYEASLEGLTYAATAGYSRASADILLGTTITADDAPGLMRMLHTAEPEFVDRSTSRPVIRELMELTDTAAAAVVPLARHGRFYGVLVAAVRDDRTRLSANPDLLERLRGLAHQGAAALQNAELVDQIRHQALHDNLTDLPNRVLLEERVRAALKQASRRGAGLGLLFIDLDRFKVVNDTLGHEAGDELIRLVGRRFEGALRSTDTLSRLGGDEFAVLLHDVDAPQAADVARKLIESLAEPFVVSDKELYVSCSIGVACAPEHGWSYPALLRHADSAMYEAKDKGPNTFEIGAGYTANRRVDRLDLESALHRVVAEEQLVVLYQPQVELTTGAIVGAEALMRWQHPALGLLGPGDFLPIAEESGLIVELDRWVRDRVLRDMATWRRDGLPEVRVAVNLSAREMRNPYLAQEIQQTLLATATPAELLELEVTDRVVMPEDELIEVLGDLKATGARLAIDDFGTGSSVLTRLSQFPIDTLKIDKSFISHGRQTEGDLALLRAIVALSHNLGLTVVAEGVETEGQAGMLRRLGCHLAQGFHFSRPMPAAELVRRLQAQMPESAGASPQS